MKKLFFISTIFLLLITAVLGWNIEVLETEFDTVSEGSEFVGIINLTASGSDEPVKPGILNDNYNITFNHSSGEGKLEWLREGLWIADFEYNDSVGTVNFTAEGGTDGTEPADQSEPVWETFEIDQGALNITSYFDGEIGPGDDISELEANITGYREVVVEKQTGSQPNNVVEFSDGYIFVAEEDVLKMYDGNGDEYWEFTNHSGDNDGNITGLEVTQDAIFTGSENGDLVKVDRDDISEGGSTSSGEWKKESLFSNITSVVATSEEDRIYVGDKGDNPLVKLESNGDKVWEKLDSSVEVYDLESIEGDVVAVQGTGGSGDNLTKYPGDGSSSEWTYTGHSGNPLTVDVFKGNIYSVDSSELHRIETDDGSIGETETLAPDISGNLRESGSFSRGIAVAGSSGDLMAFDQDLSKLWGFTSHSVEVTDIGHGGSSIVSVDGNGKIYRSDRFNDFLDEQGSVKYIFWNETGKESGKLEALDDEKHFLSEDQEVDVPESDGGIILTLKSNYTTEHFTGLNGSDSTFLDFDSESETFELGDDIEIDTDFNANYTKEIKINSSINDQLNVSTDPGEDIEDVVEINDTVEIENGGSESLEVNFTIDSVDDMSGTIEFQDQDSEFSSSVNVELDAPEYDVRNGSLAVLAGNDGEIDELIESETENVSIELFYFGENLTGDEETINVDTSVSGNISDHVSIQDFDMNNSKDYDIEFSPVDSGNFSGNLTFSTDENEISLNTSIESELGDQEAEISLPFTLDLGAAGEEASKTGNLDVENIGDSGIDGLEFNSEDFNVSGENVSIEIDEMETVEVEFESVDTETGTLEVTGVVEGGQNAESSVEISFDLLDDFESRIEELESNLDSLGDNANDSQQTEIENLRVQIQNAQSAFESENWDEALEDLETVEEDVDTLSQEIDTAETPSSSDPADPVTDTGSDQEGGGLPVIPIFLILVLLAGGFVAWSSIIPEEGDPLYEVLGDG